MFWCRRSSKGLKESLTWWPQYPSWRASARTSFDIFSWRQDTATRAGCPAAKTPRKPEGPVICSLSARAVVFLIKFIALRWDFNHRDRWILVPRRGEPDRYALCLLQTASPVQDKRRFSAGPAPTLLNRRLSGYHCAISGMASSVRSPAVTLRGMVISQAVFVIA